MKPRIAEGDLERARYRTLQVARKPVDGQVERMNRPLEDAGETLLLPHPRVAQTPSQFTTMAGS